MLRQMEGSQAVAEAVALLPARGDLRLPDLAPDPHRRGALRHACERASSTPCEFINVESEFAAMSVAIGASAAGARAYTATASQGLLYMVEALYNASGLGLPIVMTVANRAIGAPINIWNDHSDSMSQRDSGWIQLYAETNQEALDLHIQAFRLAEELSLPVMVCMDGFILTHAYERVDVPDAGAGGRLPAAVRAAPGARPGRAGDDRRDGRARRRSPRSSTSMHAKQMQALDLIPEIAGEFAQRLRPRLGRPAPQLPHATTPRRSWSRSARCSARSRTWSTSCATQGVKIGAVGIKSLPAVPARRGARGARPREARGGAREGVRGRRRRHRVGQNVRLALSGIRLHGYTTWSPGSAGGRSPRRRCARLFADALDGQARAADLPRHGLGARRARARAPAAERRPGPHAENILRDIGIVAARPH